MQWTQWTRKARQTQTIFQKWTHTINRSIAKHARCGWGIGTNGCTIWWGRSTKKEEPKFDEANSTQSASHKSDLSGTTRSTTTRRSAPGGPKLGEPNIQSTRRTHKPVSQTCSGWLDIQLRGRSKLPAHTCYCEQMNASYYMHEQVHMEEIRSMSKLKVENQ